MNSLVCKYVAAIVLALVANHTQSLIAQEDSETPESNYNWEVATLGGSQFWTDVRIEGGWRIQRNAYFGHYRLLDEENVRKAWGKYRACSAELEKYRKEGLIEPYKGKVVVLLHGLGRTWKSLQALGEHLENEGYSVIHFRYASTRKQVADHARRLRGVIRKLPATVTEINFVAHSLGNIVVRHYVADCDRSKMFDVDPRIRRMVMLGPPNQGSRMARILKECTAFKVLAGATGAELSVGWKELNERLATPKFEFGIIAGCYGVDEAPLNNFLLPGPDDFTVSEKETMLVGATDFFTRPLFHTTMMDQPEVFEATTRFLNEGFFVARDAMRPINKLARKKSEK